MSITLKQATHSKVFPRDDGRLYDFLKGGTDGVVTGCTCAASGNTLTVQSGWGIIKGRMFTIDTESIVVTTEPTSTECRLRVAIDISNLDTPVSLIVDKAPFSDLMTEDINNGGTRYDLVLATFTINSAAITNVVKAYTEATKSQGDKAIYASSIYDNGGSSGTAWKVKVQKGTSGTTDASTLYFCYDN